MTTLHNPIHIAGISIVTSNDEAFKENTIGKLWEEFLKLPVKEKLGAIASHNCYSVYSDYENGDKGKYKVTLGYAVENLDGVSPELSVTTIPAGDYKIFKSGSASKEDVVTTWQQIWGTSSKALPRNFVADFEEYNENGVLIYIGYRA